MCPHTFFFDLSSRASVLPLFHFIKEFLSMAAYLHSRLGSNMLCRYR